VRTAEALAYYQLLTQVDPAKVASSMVEYCCAQSFQQAPDLIFDFAIDALQWRSGGMWNRHSSQWRRHANRPTRHGALANLTAATQQMRQGAVGQRSEPDRVTGIARRTGIGVVSTNVNPVTLRLGRVLRRSGRWTSGTRAVT
jgi:hypothetical protein